MAELLIHRADQPSGKEAFFRTGVNEHVRWSDTDMIGHVNNLAFAAYLETGRALFLRDFTTAEGPSRALFLLGEMTTRFLGEAHWPAAIDAGTGVIETGRRTVRLAQGLFDGDRCIATSESTLVLPGRDHSQIPRHSGRSQELAQRPHPGPPGKTRDQRITR